MMQGADQAEFFRGLDVSRETSTRLDSFATLVRAWTRKINLVSAASLPDIVSRHFQDSAQLLSFAPLAARHWADLGSGGGFPGVVIAILAQELRPELRVTLVESDQRKAAFLRVAARETGVAVNIIADRIESIAPLGCDVVSARALAPLTDLLGFAAYHLHPDGCAIFPKGRRANDEIDASRRIWTFDMNATPSETDPEAVILTIRDIRRA